MRFRAGGGEGLRANVRARQPEHLVPGLDEVLNDGGADEAGRAGHEYTHGNLRCSEERYEPLIDRIKVVMLS